MAISTVTINDTMEWAKRLSFNRLSAIGNSLEPALTSAQMVMDTILAPPFEFWWNTQELAFTTSPTPNSSTITNVSVTAGIATITTANTFGVGNIIIPSLVGTATFLNGQLLIVLPGSTATQILAQVTTTTYASAPDTGTLTNATTQDYTIPAPAFSHIEHATILDTSKTPPNWVELKVQNNLALDSRNARPMFVGPEVEDGAGNVTFRVMPSPNQVYPVSIHVQLAAPRITSINQTWSPMPDFMQYIYSWGFLALIWAFADDPRFQVANSKFTAGLLARAEGLTEEERNIFMNNWNVQTNQASGKSQQGNQARQM
jgi:hypothetical protein